ncbi:MAG: hypothetical protein GX623_03880 [Clostridiales bacterium]|nr:hypothetical protein [Clostridiales bacterium]
MIAINTAVTVLYYLICAFFLAAIAYNFVKTRKVQESVLYGLMMIPFILRLLRLK